MTRFSRWLPVIGMGIPSLGFSQAALISGNVRVQFLSPTLVRIEQKGPAGFEDRPTFNIVNRHLPFSKIDRVSHRKGAIDATIGKFTVRIPDSARLISDIVILSATGETVYRPSGNAVADRFLPSPGAMPKVWAMSDHPRIVPPAWGAAPPPTRTDPASGWDRTNDSPDLYLFLASDYGTLRHDFLALTGSTEKPPLYAFGLIDSRYHPYHQQEALDVIRTYRQKRIPLDVFTIDTDWRVNGSDGYDVETKLFPEMASFLSDVHRQNLRVMFNDHPNPISKDPLDPKELAFRFAGLTKFLGMGVDVWWYDRNWMTSLGEPLPGLRKEVWGQRLYHDMTLAYRPNVRPLIMTNFQGIDNGNRHYAPQPAGHRYPMWWTGDTGSEWEFLQKGVANGVDMGLLALSPYVGEDLGGHTGQPSPELYIRYLQYGCLSPTTRIHCTRGRIRYPWMFGAEAERIVTDFIRFRYRLLPTLYSAAQRNYEDGTPILRRNDLEWPMYSEASRSDEYMLGDDVLVAPIIHGESDEMVPVPSDGFRAEFFDGMNLQGPALLSRIDKKIDFDWGEGSPASQIPVDRFSARWTGTIGPIVKSGTYTLNVRSDDGARLWIDGKQIVDAWVPQDNVEHRVQLRFEAGSVHAVRLEYFEDTGGAKVSFRWRREDTKRATVSKRDVWIPPGQWRSLLTGETVSGPTTIVTEASLAQCPMWVRAGGIVTLGPDVQYTQEKPWDRLLLHAFVPEKDTAISRNLAEDDGISNEYRKGQVARTRIDLERRGKSIKFDIGPAVGRYRKMPATRSWTVKFELLKNMDVHRVSVDGVRQPHFVVKPSRLLAPGTSAMGRALTVSVTKSPVVKSHHIQIELN